MVEGGRALAWMEGNRRHTSIRSDVSLITEIEMPASPKYFFELGEYCDIIFFKKGIQFPDLILNTCRK